MHCHHEWEPVLDTPGLAYCLKCHDEIRYETLLLEMSDAVAELKDVLAKVCNASAPDPWNDVPGNTQYASFFSKDLLNKARKLLGWIEV
jgi:hypothetical protein